MRTKLSQPLRGPICRRAVLLAAIVMISGPAAAEDRDTPTIAHIRISGMVRQSPPDMSLFGDNRHVTLADWLKRLAKARNDDNVHAVALDIDAPALTWSQAVEIADAVGRLRKVKPVYAHVRNASFTQYLVASQATEIAMEPTGTLLVVGLAGEMLFFRQALDNLKLTPQLVQIGKFKGAAEPFMSTGPSKELLQSRRSLMDDLYRQMQESIAQARKLKTAAVREAIDRGPLATDDAIKAGLVDRKIESIKWRAHVATNAASNERELTFTENYGRKNGPDVDMSNPFALLGLLLGGGKTSVRAPSIAIIHAEGMILSGKSGQRLLGQQVTGDQTLTRCFGEAADDDRIKAVVFRIDSPGGSADASELIYQAVRNCASRKPVIVSISGMAASGGYYIACGGKKIIADEPAIIGSIGVVSGKIASDRLMEWVGITRHELTRGANAGIRLNRPLDDREMAVITKLAQRWYDTFASRVTESRGKRIKDIDKVAHGRLFTAAQAADNGMIDGIGGFKDAVEMAKKAAGLKACHYVTMPRPRTLADLLSGSAEASSSLAKQLAAKLNVSGCLAAQSRGAAYLLNLLDLMMSGDGSSGKVLAAAPYYLEIKP